MLKCCKPAPLTFGLAWTTYFLVYCLRKPLGIIKLYLESEFHLSQAQLGWVDVSLLLPYALVQISVNSKWDTASPKKVIAVGLAVSAIPMALIGLTSSLGPFCVLVAISGAAQAPLWPACIKATTVWTSPTSVGTTVGMLGTAPFAGAAVSAAIVSYISDRSGWRSSILPICLSGLVTAVLVHVLLPVPKVPKVQSDQQNTVKDISSVWSIKAVPDITVAAFNLKFVRYALYMWLPLYLTESLAYSKTNAGLMSAVFDIGGAVGGPLIGHLADKSKNKMMLIYHIVTTGTMAMAAFALAGSMLGTLGVGALLAVIGICICGTDPILMGAITTELGDADGLNMGAGVTSFVNGVGSIGGILEGPLIGLLALHVGWSGVLACMVLATWLTAMGVLQANMTLMTEAKLKSHRSNLTV